MDPKPDLLMFSPLVAIIVLIVGAVVVCIAYRIARSRRPPDPP